MPSQPPVHIALVRAVNVGGKNAVGMAELRELVTGLGFGDVRSLLASGNLVFRGGRAKGAALERLLEREAARRLGLETDFLVRTPAELDAVIEHNPFPAEAERDPGRLVVMFLRAAPPAAAVRALEAAITGREYLRAKGPHAWIVYPDGQGRSRLTATVIEKHLGSRGTARNWNTVLKLAALARA